MVGSRTHPSQQIRVPDIQCKTGCMVGECQASRFIVNAQISITSCFQKWDTVFILELLQFHQDLNVRHVIQLLSPSGQKRFKL